MKKNRITDQEIAGIFEKDATGIVPDATIQERLEYTFMVKSSGYKTAQNSFFGMLTWLFSWSQIPLKAALVSVVVLLSIINFQPKTSKFILPGCDTTQNQIFQHIDSAGMLPFYADSCLNTKS